MALRTLAPLALGLLLAGAPHLSGQRVPEPCPYDACALRATAPGLFSRGKVLQGITGEEITKAEPSKELRALLAVSDSGSLHYGRFASAAGTARFLTWTAVALNVAGWLVVRSEEEGSGNGGLRLGLVLELSGFGVGMAATTQRARAQTELSHAIWWYNARLARTSQATSP